VTSPLLADKGCGTSSTNRHNACKVLYQQTQCVQSPLPPDKMCSKSSTNRHDVWQKHLQSKMNSHLHPQVTQNNISAKLKIQIKTFIQETKLSLTVAYSVSLYRNCSLHILNQWITDPAIFKDGKFKYQHYYNNDEFEYCTIMGQHKQPFTYMLPVWRVCFSSVNNGHLLTSIRYQTVTRYSIACVPLVKNIINAFVHFISSIQICTEF